VAALGESKRPLPPVGVAGDVDEVAGRDHRRRQLRRGLFRDPHQLGDLGRGRVIVARGEQHEAEGRANVGPPSLPQTLVQVVDQVATPPS